MTEKFGDQAPISKQRLAEAITRLSILRFDIDEELGGFEQAQPQADVGGNQAGNLIEFPVRQEPEDLIA